MENIRNNWTEKEIQEIYNSPLLDLIFRASKVHRDYHDSREMKLNTLISVKTGACVEDCAYCSQSARYNTDVESHKLMETAEVISCAEKAKENGVSRVCLSSSWRNFPDDEKFDKVLSMVKEVQSLNMEVCCTMGMISVEQARVLKEAGVKAYNHNLDTSERYYPNIVTTRKYKDRLQTLKNLQKAEMPYCSGGIIGLGENEEDRVAMLYTLASMEKHPFTVPLNTLIPVAGTPLENNPMVAVWDMVRLIATARIVMPATIICLAAGRINMNQEGQALCFLAGANSIFLGEKLLTTDNPESNSDKNMLEILGFNKISV